MIYKIPEVMMYQIQAIPVPILAVFCVKERGKGWPRSLLNENKECSTPKCLLLILLPNVAKQKVAYLSFTVVAKGKVYFPACIGKLV